MATDRQITANRLNAQRSTGPTSEAGKARSRLNAVTHGLTGELEVLPLRASTPFIERKQSWEAQIRPETDEARYTLDRAIVASFRIAQCEDTFDAMVVEQTTRARLAWDVDCRVAATILADKLSRKPALISIQLEATRHGCEWKIAMWNSLGQTLIANGSWTEAQTAIALDLLGVAPALRVGRTAVDPPENADPIAHQQAIVIGEIDRLNTLNETTLIAIDDLDRLQAEHTAMALLSAPALRLHRYEREAWKRFNTSMKAARKRGESEPEVLEKIEVKPAPQPVPATNLDDDIERQEAVIACYEEADHRYSLCKTTEEATAVLAEMYSTVDRLRDRAIPLLKVAKESGKINSVEVAHV